MSRVGLVFHESVYRHVADPRHPESPERVRAILRHLDGCGLLDRVTRHEPEPASREDIERAHTSELVDLLVELDADGGGRIDVDTGMNEGSLEATLRAAQGTIDAAAFVLNDTWDGAFVCMRPPGHHATSQRPMGFCLTNHVAVAARCAIETGGASRIAVIDWDAHHGNGTQEIFWTDPSVLYVSLHQYPWYPGTGDATEHGEDSGRGYTLNVPLPAGAAEDAYTRAVDELIEPIVCGFEPDLIFVSAGYDAHHLDPLCMMRLTAGAFFRLAKRMSGWGRGPVCVLEGGYDLDALGWSVAATISGLLGEAAAVGVPDAELEAIVGTSEATRWVDRAVALRSML